MGFLIKYPAICIGILIAAVFCINVREDGLIFLTCCVLLFFLTLLCSGAMDSESHYDIWKYRFKRKYPGVCLPDSVRCFGSTKRLEWERVIALLKKNEEYSMIGIENVYIVFLTRKDAEDFKKSLEDCGVVSFDCTEDDCTEESVKKCGK